MWLRWTSALLVLGAGFWLIPVAGAQGADPAVEYKLATIQNGGYVAPDDPLVGQFGQVLDSLSGRCTESRTTLGDYSLAGVRVLERRGVYDETPLSLLQHLGGSMPDPDIAGLFPMACDQVLAAYIVLRAPSP